jgi:hypothetical protein
MVDLILLASLLGAAYAGFWAGKKYQTIGATLKALKDLLH